VGLFVFYFSRLNRHVSIRIPITANLSPSRTLQTGKPSVVFFSSSGKGALHCELRGTEAFD
jgi:hypothetical protein